MVAVAGWAAALCIALLAVRVEAAPGSVLHLHVRGVVNPIKVRYVKNALERARDEHSALVLISIDTPGGLVSSMQDIVRGITNSPVPVVGLVEPRTAQATSAGAFILLATDVAAMLPDTRVGAAHPVGAGAPLEGAMEQKATNDLVSLAKSLLVRRGRPQKLAEAIVRNSSSYTADEAKSEGVVELIAASVSELLTMLEGRKLDFPDRRVTLSTRSATIVEVPMSLTNRALDAIADPTVASLLVTIGLLGILYELSAPGIGLGGIVGVIALLLGLLAMSVLPIRFAGFAMILAGFAAAVLEVKAPTHGVLGFGGLVAVLFGAVILVDEGRYFGAAQSVNLRILGPAIVVLGAGFLALATLAAKALRAPPLSGIESLKGARGTVRDALVATGDRFSGTVFVEGARWRAVSNSAIEAGAAVEVVKVLFRPTRFEVKPVTNGEV